MRTRIPFAVWCVLELLAFGAEAADGPYDRYLWQAPRVANIDPQRTAPLIEILRTEVDRILAAGPLAPLRMAYADLPYEAYWLYYERGRIITTLASAYPHVDLSRQQSIQQHVRTALAGAGDAPWVPGLKRPTDGAPRALSGVRVTEGRFVDYLGDPAGLVPTLHVFYGLWLYGDRTGDWDTLRSHWAQIKEAYARDAATTVILYGQMGAHLALARMSARFGDDAMLRTAVQELERDFNAGKDLARIEERQKQSRYKVFYDPRNAPSFPGQPWMFLDLCPEVARYLTDHVKEAVLQRADAFIARYPLWWLHQAPYSARWTGDEGEGLPADCFGMIYPLERWVRSTPPEKLALYLRSVPTGVGDCYWIEGLVQTIEAFGAVTWQPITPRP
jgi:hypothetical protein